MANKYNHRYDQNSKKTKKNNIENLYNLFITSCPKILGICALRTATLLGKVVTASAPQLVNKHFRMN